MGRIRGRGVNSSQHPEKSRNHEQVGRQRIQTKTASLSNTKARKVSKVGYFEEETATLSGYIFDFSFFYSSSPS